MYIHADDMQWYDHHDAALRHLRNAMDHTGDAQLEQAPDWINVLRCVGRAQEHMSHFTVHAVQQALNAGVTKKAMAQALDVPVSTFRGMEKTS